MPNLYNEEISEIIDKIIEEDDIELNWQTEMPQDQSASVQNLCNDPILDKAAELYADINLNLEEILANYENFKDDTFFKSNLILNLENIVTNLESIKNSISNQQVILSIPLA